MAPNDLIGHSGYRTLQDLPAHTCFSSCCLTRAPPQSGKPWELPASTCLIANCPPPRMPLNRPPQDILACTHLSFRAVLPGHPLHKEPWDLLAFYLLELQLSYKTVSVHKAPDHPCPLQLWPPSHQVSPSMECSRTPSHPKSRGTHGLQREQPYTRPFLQI